MSVDVEDYFQVQAFAGIVPRADWESLPCRVEANVDRILEALRDTGTRATFLALPGIVWLKLWLLDAPVKTGEVK